MSEIGADASLYGYSPGTKSTSFAGWNRMDSFQP